MTTFPGIEIEKKIYQNPSTTVYTGKRLKDGTAVVLKTIRSEYPKKVALLKHEYEMLLRLQGSNKVYLEPTVDGPTLVTEGEAGTPLADFFGHGPGMETKLEIAGRLAKALADIHRHGIFHKNISPTNILIYDDHSVRYIDFALASDKTREYQGLYEPHQIPGTHAYMPPEQTGRTDQAMDFRGDLYALGAVLYHFFTDKPPFPEHDPVALVHHHLSTEPIPPHRRQESLPKKLSFIIQRLLQKQPDCRYPDAAALAEDLEALLLEWRDSGGKEAGQNGNGDHPRDLEFLTKENDRLKRLLEEKNREVLQKQEQLLKQEKMASIGTITAGIAHELKNPLNFINNFSGLCRELTDEFSELLEREGSPLKAEVKDEFQDLLATLRKNTEIINKHGKRADTIIQSMLMLSRNTPAQAVSTDLNALVDEYIGFAYHGMQAKHKALGLTIRKSFDPKIGKVCVFPQTISRVFLNIINNACYAVLGKRKRHGDGFNPQIHVATKDLGDTIRVSIRDNGDGIPDAILAKIFTPFFTTKPIGEGTGLGLAICHDIVVNEHGGSLKVDTEPGSHTEFIITLPRHLPGNES